MYNKSEEKTNPKVSEENMIDEFTFCDDCGGNDHTWENCPDTRDIPLRNPAYDTSEIGIFDGYGEYDDWQSETDW